MRKNYQVARTNLHSLIVCSNIGHGEHADIDIVRVDHTAVKDVQQDYNKNAAHDRSKCTGHSLEAIENDE
jgi:hypothetical protein